MADWPDDTDDNPFEQLDGLDTLDDDGTEDPLDQGWSPPERPWEVDPPGVPVQDDVEGEMIEADLARELPDVSPDDDWDGIGDTSDTDGEPLDDEVGDERSGRLVAADEGGSSDTDDEMFAEDVGVDGAAASAEEAAMHTVADDEPEV
jgi:uncharacterized protein DUF5709